MPKPTPDQFQVVPTTALLEAELDSHLRTVEAARGLLPATAEVAAVLCAAFATGHLLFSFGNGGSAADAQHLTGELIGHYRADRRPLGAVTLTTDPTVTTCIANDYAWEKVFARQVTGLARPGDVVAAFTTSGRSANVVEGLRAAQDAGATTVLFTGGDGGPARHHADHVLLVPSTSTPRIQEVHTLLLHVISGIVDVWAVEQPAVVAAGGGGAR